MKFLKSLKEFWAETEKQFGKCIKGIRSSRGEEYLVGDFKDYLAEAMIVSQLITLTTPSKMVW